MSGVNDDALWIHPTVFSLLSQGKSALQYICHYVRIGHPMRTCSWLLPARMGTDDADGVAGSDSKNIRFDAAPCVVD